MVSSLSNNVQEFIDINIITDIFKQEESRHDAVLARTYLKYVRAQRTSLLTCDKAETMVFTMVLALPQEQDCDVVGEPQVLTVF